MTCTDDNHVTRQQAQEAVERARRRLDDRPPREFSETAHQRYYEMGIEDALREIRGQL